VAVVVAGHSCTARHTCHHTVRYSSTRSSSTPTTCRYISSNAMYRLWGARVGLGLLQV
jgi:hypothetical protein